MMKRIRISSIVRYWIVVIGLTSVACSSTQKNIRLEPGKQISRADIDLESGTVAQTIKDVRVSVTGVILPGSDGESFHPTFWVTIKNNRMGKITLNPAKARLVDSFGNQYRPLPMAVNGNDDESVYYRVIDPDVRSFISVRYGWNYYPFYPHRIRHHRGRYSRIQRVHFDPYWSFGTNLVWVKRVYKTGKGKKLPDRIEEVYDDAKITYALSFPALNEDVKDYRLIIPGVEISENDKKEVLKFEMIFDQIIEMNSDKK